MDYQLVIMHRGTLDLQLDGRLIHVAAGQAILLSPKHREHFFFTPDGETHHSWCAIAPGAAPQKLAKIFRGACKPAPFTGQMMTLLDHAKQLSARTAGEGVLDEALSLCLGLALLCEFANTVASGGSRDAAVDAIARLESFIQRQYAQPLNLADMARAAGVSQQHLMKLFRQRGTTTPKQFLYHKRLEAASDLLAHTGLSIAEIAERCGFANAFHFSRKFRELFGKSPRAWRTQAWSDLG
jgi:AraC family transcriptional regulator of arabinose operon